MRHMNININQVNHIGSRIKLLMENKNEDSKMLAPLMGISESQLNRLLADRYRWTEEKVMWFANRYNVSFLSLFFGITDDDIEEYGEPELMYLVSNALDKVGDFPLDDKKRFVKFLLLELAEMVDRM